MPGKPAAEEVRREQILQAAFEAASRDGIGGLTVRAVAAEAKLSHALVLFHFGRKERLVNELLDWLIETTSRPTDSEEIDSFSSARDRLHALLEREMERLSQQPRRTRLFFEYWALGARYPTIRARIGAELERYRGTFRANMEELIEAEPATFDGVSADGLAAVAVSCIHGCAVQAMNDPENFDCGEYLTAVRGIIG